MKEAWEFLHSEGHINQGVLQGEPADQQACKPPPSVWEVVCVITTYYGTAVLLASNSTLLKHNIHPRCCRPARV